MNVAFKKLRKRFTIFRLTSKMIIPSLKITQLLHQPLYIYKIYTIYTLNIEKAPKSFGPKTIIRDLYIPC